MVSALEVINSQKKSVNHTEYRDNQNCISSRNDVLPSNSYFLSWYYIYVLVITLPLIHSSNSVHSRINHVTPSSGYNPKWLLSTNLERLPLTCTEP